MCGYPKGGYGDMLLRGIGYYGMAGRHNQNFGYAIPCLTKRDDEEVYDRWEDPFSMYELQWLLARPTLQLCRNSERISQT